MSTDDSNWDHGQHRFRVAVAKADFDFHAVEVDDPKPTGRQLLKAAGFRPPEEHLIFQVLDDGVLEERRLDETVELREKEAERFIAFRSDRSFRVEIDGRRFEWGAAELTGLIVKQLAGADPVCTGVWLDRRDEPDLLIEDTGLVKLEGQGIEKLHTGPLFLLWIEGKEFAAGGQSQGSPQSKSPNSVAGTRRLASRKSIRPRTRLALSSRVRSSI